MNTIIARIREALEQLRPVLRADGGDVEFVGFEEGTVTVRLTRACSGCPSAGATLKLGIEKRLMENVPEVRAVVAVGSATPSIAPRGGHAGSPFDNRNPIEGVAKIIAVASGKGGVGKSTVAVNLAIALSKTGAKVGLMDADVYGPSIPTMLGIRGRAGVDGEDGLLPIVKHGISLMSIGFLLEDDSPVIWRGPMVMKLITEFIRNVRWGRLDYLVMDLPPGTGDVQLTLVQTVPISGAVIVTTPSDVALIDARRGLKMFEKTDVPVLGIVENMSTFICPHCAKETDIFSRGGGRMVAAELKVPFLGEIPIHTEIRYAGDKGEPVGIATPASKQSRAFIELAERVRSALADPSENWKKTAGTIG